MPTKSGIEVKGDKELKRLFEILPAKVNKKILLSAFRKGARPLIKQARVNAPKDEGDLKRSIGTVTAKPKNRNKAAVRIGPRRGKAKTANGFHGHLVEFGTAPRKTESGRFTGAMPANPFMAPAWESEKGDVQKTINDSIGEVVEKVIKSTLKRKFK